MTVIPAVLSYNRPDLAEMMYDQLSGVIIFENGTLPEKWLSLQVHCQQRYSKENLFFSGGWNWAMRELASLEDNDAVWMLNSDVQGISYEMMLELRKFMVNYDYAVISPAFNSPHAHMQVQSTDLLKPAERLRKVKWIDWTCPLVSMKAWRDVGEFDERFKGYGADVDWCFRAAQKGYRLVVSDSHECFHLGSQTALSEGLQGVQGNTAEMHRLLDEKWGPGAWSRLA